MLGHGEVGAVVDAGDGALVLSGAHGAEELEVGAFFLQELRLAGKDGVLVEEVHDVLKS
jgi:hypothetical protein